MNQSYKKKEKKESPVLLDIKENKLHQFYLIYGEEDYLVRDHKNKLKNVIMPEEDQMNYAYFEGENLDFAKISELAQTMPFFQEHRLIVMENTKLFKEANDFADYLSNFPESTIVIFVEKEADARLKLFKYVKKNGVVDPCDYLEENELVDWVVIQLSKRGHLIRKSTVNYFILHMGRSLATIDQELQKLCSYAEGRKEITIADINAVCCFEVSDNIFEMTDAIAEKKLQKVLYQYHEMLEEQKSEVYILSMIVRHFNLLLQVKDFGPHADNREVAKKLKSYPGYVSRYQAQCRQFTMEQIKYNIERCSDYDFAFKTGQIDNQLGLEVLLTELVMGE